MKGFSLIELLAVVAIIGILAGIALPQYQKAVEKSRAAEGVVQAKAIRDGILLHFQEAPDDPADNKSKIAWVKIPSDVAGYGNMYRTKHFQYILGANNSFTVQRINGATFSGTVLYSIIYRLDSGGNWSSTTSGCDDSKYKGACQLFTNN